MITDPLVIFLPDGHVFPVDCLFTEMYILGDWGLLFSILFSVNCLRCRCHFEQDIVLAISSPFLGGAAMEVCGFFSPVAERLAR